MTVTNPRLEEGLRTGFKYGNKFMLLMWRLGLGKMINFWPDVGGRIMVLTHTGWKSGLQRRTPLNYAIVDGELYCTAGFGVKAHWYKNIMATPEVEVWLPDGRWAGVAEDITDHPDRVQLFRAVLIGSGFAAWAAGLHPKSMPDVELAWKLLSNKGSGEIRIDRRGGVP